MFAGLRYQAFWRMRENQVVVAMKRSGLSIVLAGMAALASLGSTPAAAQESEAMKSILGAIGIVPKDPPQIDYRERAPLVLPPKLDLPAPADAKAAESQANWPRDPDVAAARREAEEARKPYTLTDDYRLNQNSKLSPEEMRAMGRRPSARTTTPDPAANDNRSDISRLSVDQMRALDKQHQQKSQTTNLQRRYLSDPPANLLQSATGGPLKATVDAPTDRERDRWMGR